MLDVEICGGGTTAVWVKFEVVERANMWDKLESELIAELNSEVLLCWMLRSVEEALLQFG